MSSAPPISPQVIARLKTGAAALAGVTLYMQPVQDLTIDGPVSRTQYQFVLQDANADELAEWTPKLLAKLNTLPQLADVASDLSHSGLAVFVDIDRDQAARFGITPATIDNALYDAFGQRIVSTIFTTSNQYRVILEADPSLQQIAEVARRRSTCRRRRAAPRCRFPVVANDARRHRAAADHPYGAIPRHHRLVQPGARRVARRGGHGDQAGAGRDRHADQRHHHLPGRGARLPGLARPTRCS